MKTLIGRRKQRNIHKIKEKFQALHKKINGSTVDVFSRKEEELILENSITVDDTQTNISDGSCEIVFPKVFYDFITNTLPEEPEQTQSKLMIINSMIQQSSELKDMYNKEGYLTFSRNLFNGFYNSYLNEYLLKVITDYENIDFSNEEEFIIIVRDSLNNEFVKTNNFARSKMIANSSFSIRCPLNDSETTVKDGFNPNDVPYFFYKNIKRSLEIPLKIVADSLTIQNLKSIVVTGITINIEDVKKYNGLHYELLHGNIK